MNDINIIITIIGAVVVAIGLFSAVLKNRLPLTLPLMATVLGILVGPRLLNLINPAAWGDWMTILQQTARLTLGISLMEISLRLPRRFILNEWRSLAVVLGLVMPLMFIVSGLLSWLFLSVSFWGAMLLGACITPTDPVASSSIVTGRVAEKLVPGRIRNIISAEAGANDGLAYLMVLLPLLVLQYPPAIAMQEWLIRVLLWEILFAVFLGIVIGIAAGKALLWAEKKELIEQRFFLGYTIAVSLVTLGGVSLLRSDGILAVFAAGVAINSTFGGQERAPEEHVQEVVNLFFVLPVFVLLGTMLPWEAWLLSAWPLTGLAAAVLLLRRLPLLLLFKPAISVMHSRRDALFAGWFGPIAVAAVYYITLAHHSLNIDWIWNYGSFLILASVVVHGLTALPFSRWYNRHRTAVRRDNPGSQ